ncbi:hypothetical protein [Acinetobacter nosocomialis]|uniref:hypothetical protein n=1 Tax=Acinetobacter nosocomialis TaxID=106654 RepID=UPI00124F9717|nr:hypothetical protein [Acinetobacter nosocomialis]MBP1483064.1 hypothetical protein [Acinetobacter nosocomialis]
MKKISTLAVSISFIMLTGCGGGSSSSNNTENVSSQAQEQSTQNVSSQAQGQSAQNVNSLKCDRGILLNSTLSTNTIFDETLYSLNYRFKEISSGNPPTSIPQLYAYEIKRNDQMLYAYPKALYNITADEIESSLAEDIVQSYDLNSFGLFTKKTYQKQNNGWPLGYVVASQGSQITTAQFNDTCSLNSDNVSYDYEKIDVSGKKISDIFPSNILTSRPENIDYLYMSNRFAETLKNNQTAFTSLLNSNATFPSGSFVYVPKSVVYNNTEFYFFDSSLTSFKTVAEWQQALYPKANYKFDTVAGYNVTYSVDSAGNQIYSGGKDPAIEMNGKIYDGEWQVKGNVVSETYGEPAIMSTTNYETKGKFALYNKASYDFLVAQIQTYYK